MSDIIRRLLRMEDGTDNNLVTNAAETIEQLERERDYYRTSHADAMRENEKMKYEIQILRENQIGNQKISEFCDKHKHLCDDKLNAYVRCGFFMNKLTELIASVNILLEKIDYVNIAHGLVGSALEYNSREEMNKSATTVREIIGGNNAQ